MADALHGAFDERFDSPRRPATADLEYETVQQSRAIFCVGNFRMELEAENPAVRVFHRRHCRCASRGDDEARGRLDDAIAVTHPNSADAVQQRGGSNKVGLPESVPPLGPRLDSSSQLLCEQLHAIADT